MDYPFVPYDYGGDFPDDFFEKIMDEGNYNGQEGWFVDYPDDNQNGYADFYDNYDPTKPDVILRPSQGTAGG